MKIDNSFKKFADDCKKITEYYIETRYPGINIDVDEKTASNVLENAKEIFKFVTKKLA